MVDVLQVEDGTSEAAREEQDAAEEQAATESSVLTTPDAETNNHLGALPRSEAGAQSRSVFNVVENEDTALRKANKNIHRCNHCHHVIHTSYWLMCNFQLHASFSQRFFLITGSFVRRV